MLAQIIAAEEKLNTLLPPKRLTGSPPTTLLEAAKGWSGLVWAEAERLGPMPLCKQQVEDGLNLATQPVFICGVHRSGTTLVRNLLDGHPSLNVLPSEGTFYTNLEQQLKQLPADKWAAHLGTEWLRRLANPINQPPYWLLGRSKGEASPYVDFARYLLSWWRALEQKPGTQWPHVAIAMAYAACNNALSAAYWVDKTPTNERFLARIRQEAPDARIIHVVRHPLGTIASRKVMEPGAALSSALRDLKASYRIAHREAALNNPAYLLVQYEELCDEPEKAMARMAAFLGIKNLSILQQTTVAGVPADANSSFTEGAAPGQIRKADGPVREVLNGDEQQLIAAYLGRQVAKLGYQLPEVSLFRKVWLRMKYKLFI